MTGLSESGYGAHAAFEWLGEMQWGESSYDFDLTAVFKSKETGELYLAHDSGCSCPSPFENTDFEDLTPITSLKDFDDAVQPRMNAENYGWYSEGGSTYGDHGPTVDAMVRLRKIVEVNL